VITKAEQQHREEASQDSPEEKTCLEAGGSIFNWSSTHTSVFENEKYVQLTILRRGDLSKVAMVKYETSSGSAMAGVDFVHTQGAAKFPPGAAEFVVKVGVIDDNEYEPDENFYCRLYSPSDVHVIGKFPITEVTIINDDDPGQFTFEKEVTVIPETTGTLELWIKRVNGCDGKVELKYKTTSFMDPNNAAATEGKTAEEMEKIAEKPGSGIAVPGIDYKETEGMVVFGHQETRKMISVEIINTKELSKEKAFNISFEIQEFPQCGAKYGDVKLSMVKISADLELSEAMDKVAALLDNNLEAFRVGSNSWAQQFAEAVEMPSAEEFGEGGPGCLDYFTHFATFYWKVLFAFVPPTSYCNGWLTFWMSIVFIGILTGIVGDIAGVFGCLLGISPAMTAITFVALGTSLPDTFASKQAAEEADTADASIGNVTGSNSVNVFLGQGIPWIIATSYRLATTDKSDFEVKAGSLNFSVIVFCSVACVCIFTFYIRRFFFGGELGGPTTCKYISATIMTFLWFLYIVLSYLQSEGIAFV
jgi:solute carrier family 8 (sodium/calcium exchanger)